MAKVIEMSGKTVGSKYLKFTKPLEKLNEFLLNIPYFKQISDDAANIQNLFNDYRDYHWEKDKGDVENITGPEKDALQHFYGSKVLKDKYGAIPSFLAGLFHEVEGYSELHAPESIAADLINNILGLGSKDMSGNSNLIELLEKHRDKTINDEELSILKSYIDYGIESSIKPPGYAISGWMPDEKTIIEQFRER